MADADDAAQRGEDALLFPFPKAVPKKPQKSAPGKAAGSALVTKRGTGRKFSAPEPAAGGAGAGGAGAGGAGAGSSGAPAFRAPPSPPLKRAASALSLAAHPAVGRIRSFSGPPETPAAEQAAEPATASPAEVAPASKLAAPPPAALRWWVRSRGPPAVEQEQPESSVPPASAPPPAAAAQRSWLKWAAPATEADLPGLPSAGRAPAAPPGTAPAAPPAPPAAPPAPPPAASTLAPPPPPSLLGSGANFTASRLSNVFPKVADLAGGGFAAGVPASVSLARGAAVQQLAVTCMRATDRRNLLQLALERLGLRFRVGAAAPACDYRFLREEQLRLFAQVRRLQRGVRRVAAGDEAASDGGTSTLISDAEDFEESDDSERAADGVGDVYCRRARSGAKRRVKAGAAGGVAGGAPRLSRPIFFFGVELRKLPLLAALARIQPRIVESKTSALARLAALARDGRARETALSARRAATQLFALTFARTLSNKRLFFALHRWRTFYIRKMLAAPAFDLARRVSGNRDRRGSNTSCTNELSQA